MLPVDHRSTAARRYRTCRPISRQGGPVPSRCQRRSVDNDRPLRVEHKSMAVSHAAERALSNLFPSMAGPFGGFRTALGYITAPTGQPDDPA
jgi:hypothetical protein